MLTAQEIYQNIKNLLNLNTNRDLANYLKLNYYTLGSQINNNSPDFKKIIENCDSLDLNVVFRGVEFLTQSKITYDTVIKLREEINIKNQIIDSLFTTLNTLKIGLESAIEEKTTQ